jgi:hypothetical protein
VGFPNHPYRFQSGGIKADGEMKPDFPDTLVAEQEGFTPVCYQL